MDENFQSTQPKCARQILWMSNTEQCHGLQILQRVFGNTMNNPRLFSIPAELTVGINKLSICTQNSHRNRRLEEEYMIINLLRSNHLIHMIKTSIGFFLSRI